MNMTTKKALPHEEDAELITAGELAKLLAKKGLISENEFEGLILKAFLLPRIAAMTDDNWERLRNEMVAFLQNDKAKETEQEGSNT